MRRFTIFWYPLQSVLLKRGKNTIYFTDKREKKSQVPEQNMHAKNQKKKSSDKFY